MSSIALMLKNMNVLVTGSDINETDITKSLNESGIKVLYGHHPELVKDADIIVYTAAIHEDDPERKEAKRCNRSGACSREWGAGWKRYLKMFSLLS